MESLAKLKKNVFNKASRAMFSLLKKSRVLNLPIDLQLDLFDKLVTPILLYGSEIWAYENNDIIEKLHLRYCKYILGVNKSTTSSMVYGKLCRYPLNIEYTSRCILFWARIISGPVTKLSVKMYNLLYKMYNLGIYNSPWLSFVKSTLLSAGFGYVWRDQKIPRTLEYFKKVFKTRLKDQYLQTWTDDVASNAKCIKYRMYKSDISLEFYITFLPRN